MAQWGSLCDGRERRQRRRRRAEAPGAGPETYCLVALVAQAAGIITFIASARHDYGSKLPVYALELPLVLHLIHAGIAFAIVGFAGNWAVQNFLGKAMEEGGIGPFQWAFGKTSRVN